MIIFCFLFSVSFSEIKKINSHSLYSKTSNIPDNYFLLLKFFFGIIFGFQKKKTEIKIFWIFICFIFSAFVSYKYFFFLPYKNQLLMKLIFIKNISLTYTMFLLCILYLLKNSNFNGGLFLFLIGEITIIIFFYYFSLNHPAINFTLLQPYQINTPSRIIFNEN